MERHTFARPDLRITKCGDADGRAETAITTDAYLDVQSLGYRD